MSCDIEAVRPDGPLHRLARAPDAFAWPDWAYAHPDGTFGNRWDDAQGEYRVLYASSPRLGAFIETLARFRPDQALVDGLAQIDDDGYPQDALGAGEVPVEWLTDRVIGSCDFSAAFAAVGRLRGLAYLWRELGPKAKDYGVDELDGAAIRLHAPRAFTQLVSRLVFDCEADAESQFAGIAYLSRLGDDLPNWALFEQPNGLPQLEASASEHVEHDDPDLVEALDRLGLALVD